MEMEALGKEPTGVVVQLAVTETEEGGHLTRTPGALSTACWLTAQGSSLCRLPAPSWPAPPVTGFYLATC
jgi:hypothetical protein